MGRARRWRIWWSRCSPGCRPRASTCWRGSMRTGWPRWTNCFARRRWRWRAPRVGINRTHHHWGTAATELTFGGRRVQVRRPRVRRRAGGEATLPSVATFRARDPLTARMMQQLLAGVSMRHYEGSLEARPSGRPTRGSSKSAVSRTVVRRTRQRLQEYLARRLDGLEMVALFMDGVVVAQQTVIVVLGD